MAASLEETLISVWKQALVENAAAVTLESGRYPVRRTSRSRLREVDFEFGGQRVRGLEQNPNTTSRWAQLAGKGKGHAVPDRPAIRRQCGRWKDAILWTRESGP